VNAQGESQIERKRIKMALKLVRKKKAKAGAAGGRKKSAVDKFIDAVDVQLRLAEGEKVKKGRGVAKSWLEDGAEYEVELVLNPRVGAKSLYPKSAIVVDPKQKKPPMKELKELRTAAVDGKLNGRIYAAMRQQKKQADAKKAS
jgi:hypothetical protein